MQASWNYKEYDYVYRGSMIYTFNYDGSGHLTMMSATGEDYSEYDGHKEYEKGSGKSILTWENGNLTYIETEMEWKDENGAVKEKTNTVETLVYSDKNNKYKQFLNLLDNNDFYYWYVGLLGIGSEKLPLTYHLEGVDKNYESVYEMKETLNAEFTLNENGSINTETWTDTETSWSRIAKYNYTPVGEYRPEQTKALLSPYKTKSATTGNGKYFRNLLKNGLLKSMRKN